MDSQMYSYISNPLYTKSKTKKKKWIENDKRWIEPTSNFYQNLVKPHELHPLIPISFVLETKYATQQHTKDASSIGNDFVKYSGRLTPSSLA